MATPRKVWPQAILDDLKNLTTDEFLAKHRGWHGKGVANARQDLRIRMTPAAKQRAIKKGADGNRLASLGFTKEMAETMTAAEIAARTGLTVKQVETRRYDAGWHGPKRGSPAVEYDDTIPDPTTPEALDELVEALASIKDLDAKYDPRRHTVKATVDSQAPIGVVFSGDWQIGSWGVATRLWKADMDLLHSYHTKNPGALYAIGMGDYASNLTVLDHRGSQFRDLIRPGMQLRIVRGLFRQTRGMWLGLLAGCHDTFVEKASDTDTLEEFVKLADTRHFWHGVEFTMRLGTQEYVLRVRHRYRYNSSLNELNSQRQQAAMEGPADVIAHAHLHTAVSGTMKAGGKPTVMLRSGSYQVHDDYARQYVGNVKAEPVFPMVIFWPEQHKTFLCHDFHDGLDYLTTLRSRA